MRTQSFQTHCVAVAVAVLIGFFGANAADKTAEFDAALKSISGYQHGQSRAGLELVEKLVHETFGSAADRAALQQRLVDALKSDSSVECKRFVCRQLALIGLSDSVAALGKLLTDAELSDMARYALEPIADAAVDKALIEALAKTTGKIKVGIIGSLGARRTTAAVSVLSLLISDQDELVARSAVIALGKIRTAAALEALLTSYEKSGESLRLEVAHSALAVAHALIPLGEKDSAEKAFIQFYKGSQPRTVRTAALKGLLALDSQKYLSLVLEVLRCDSDRLQPFAADSLRVIAGGSVVSTISSELPKFSPNVQALTLTALAKRGDKAAMPVVLRAAKSSDEAVRKSALSAIGILGGVEQVPMLIEMIASGSDDARNALIQLGGNEIDAAVLAAISQKPAKLQSDLLQILAARNAVSIVPSLVQMAESPSAEIQEAVFQALGTLARTEQLPSLVKLVVQARETTLNDAERALTSAVGRLDDTAKWSETILSQYSAATPVNRCALLRVLRFSGDQKALALVRKEVKSNGAEVRDAAFRTMAGWPNADPADDLLKLTREGGDKTQRVLAFRGVVRMGEMTAKSSDSGLKLLRAALDAAPRPEDKSVVLAALSTLPRMEALSLALSCLNDPKLENEAGIASLKICQVMAKTQPAAAKEALKKVIAASKSEKLKKQAQTALAKIKPSAH